MAANEKLILYIKQQFREGFSGEVIRSFLLKAGWKEHDIEQAFASALSVKSVKPVGFIVSPGLVL